MSGNSHSVEAVRPRKRPVQARSRRTVDAILDAAAHVFARDGYRAATTNHVAAEAGVSIGSLYQYFPNKDALVAALEVRHLADAGAGLRDAFVAWRRAAPEPADWATEFTATLVAVNDSELHRIVYNTAPRAPGGTDVDELVTAMARELAWHLRRWGARADVRLRATVLVVTTLAAVHEVVIQQRSPRARARAARAVADGLGAGITAAIG